MVQVVSTAMWAIIATVLAAAAVAAREQSVPCYFIFGDSVFDNGNNNNFTKARVNYSPYGIDFPTGPTGRFSNGRVIPDLIAEYLGFKAYIPSHAGSSPSQAHTGLNYASGGAGIRVETSKHLGGRISFKEQIANHRRAIRDVPPQRLNKCMYTINIGSNDYLNNYFMSPPYSTHSRYTPEKYAHSLIKLYTSHLKKLYGLGARKVMLFGISSIGCLPRIIHARKGCVKEVNDAVEIFNKKLRALVDELNKSLDGSIFTFVDLYSTGEDPSLAKLGFTVTDKSCCTVEPGEELCAANKPVCRDRSKYLFWDDVHGTEAINAVVVKSMITGLNTSPYNITHLLN